MSENSTPKGETTTPRRRFRWAAWLVRGGLAVVALWGIYLLAVNLALNTGILDSVVNRRPEKFLVICGSGARRRRSSGSAGSTRAPSTSLF
jgi:hypothetical protein